MKLERVSIVEFTVFPVKREDFMGWRVDLIERLSNLCILEGFGTTLASYSANHLSKEAAAVYGTAILFGAIVGLGHKIGAK